MKHWLGITFLFLFLTACANPAPTVSLSTATVESDTVSATATARVAATNTPPRPTAAPISPTAAPSTPTFVPSTAEGIQPPNNPPTQQPIVPTLALDTSSDVLVRATALLYERFNKERVAKGAPPLLADPTLETIARIRSQDMLTRGYFAHQDPDTGADLISSLLQQYRYPAGFWGENLVTVKGRKLDAENLSQYFANSWLASPGHADNILNPNYRHTGLGLVASADGLQVIATQVFAE